MANQYKSTNLPGLFAEERQAQILMLLQERSKLFVSELCDEFSVSPATIRSDFARAREPGAAQAHARRRNSR